MTDFTGFTTTECLPTGDRRYYCARITKNLKIGVEAQPARWGGGSWGTVTAVAADFSSVTMVDGRVIPTTPRARWETRSLIRDLV